MALHGKTVPGAVTISDGEQDIQRINDAYKAEATISVEYHLTRDDESLSSLTYKGKCEMKYRITGRARHPDGLALQVEELANKIRK